MIEKRDIKSFGLIFEPTQTEKKQISLEKRVHILEKLVKEIISKLEMKQ